MRKVLGLNFVMTVGIRVDLLSQQEGRGWQEVTLNKCGPQPVLIRLTEPSLRYQLSKLVTYYKFMFRVDNY